MSDKNMSNPKPKMKDSFGDNELAKAEKQLDQFESQVKELTLDRMNEAPKKEVEPQTQLSQKEINKHNELYLKPVRTIASREKFNEDYRKQYNEAKEYVNLIAENNEVKGERIEMWTKPFAGLPAEFWQIPVGKPIWAPRYVAERLAGCTYHRMRMDESRGRGQDNMGQYYGDMVVDETINRLDARPVREKQTVFMGAGNF